MGNAVFSSSRAIAEYNFAVSPGKEDANREAVRSKSATQLRQANPRAVDLSAGSNDVSLAFYSGDERDDSENHRPYYVGAVEKDFVARKRTAREERDAKEKERGEEMKRLNDQVELLMAQVARLDAEKASVEEHDTLRQFVLGPVQSAEWALRTSKAVLQRRLEETKAVDRDGKHNRLIRALLSTSILQEPAPVTSTPSLKQRAPLSPDEVRNLVRFFEDWKVKAPHRAGMFLEAAQIHLANQAQRNPQAHPTCKLSEWAVLMQSWCRRFKITKVEMAAEFSYIAPAVIRLSGGFDGPAFPSGVVSHLPVSPPTRIAISDASGSVGQEVPPATAAQGQARATGEVHRAGGGASARGQRGGVRERRRAVGGRGGRGGRGTRGGGGAEPGSSRSSR
ncbi:hypothetical protein JCM3770_004965 [Rhodotorula araucariae]